VHVETFGPGGAGLHLLPDDRWATRLLQDELLFRPLVVVFVHLGENDLIHLSVNLLVDLLINYIKSIITLSHPLVIIVSHLFPMSNHNSQYRQHQ